MKIELRVSSILKNKVPSSKINLAEDKWELSEGTSVADILQVLNLPNSTTILVVNNRQVDKEAILRNGDVFQVFSTISGG